MTAADVAPAVTEPSLEGRVALVVGGYGGLGAAICDDLVSHGARVVVAGRDAAAATALATGLDESRAPTTTPPGDAGVPRVVGAGIDITDVASIDAALDLAEGSVGAVDLVVNAASTLRTHPAEHFPEDEFRLVVEANLVGPFLLSRTVGRRWLERGIAGRLVHLSSVRGSAGAPGGFAAYGPAKAGLDLLVRQLATEWGPRGVTVNAVAPGFVPTGFVPGVEADEALVGRMRQRIPLRRFAVPDDIAATVRWLLGPGGGFVNGQIVYVDGGVTASQ